MKKCGRISITGWIKKYLAYSFVNKIFSVYFIITLAAGISLVLLLSGNLKDIKYSQTIDLSNQILTTIDNFMENKLEAQKTLFQNMIHLSEERETITELLDDSLEGETLWQECQDIRDQYSSMLSSVDLQFSGLYAYGFEGKKVLALNNNADSGNYYYFETLTASLEAGEPVMCRIVTDRGNHLNNMFSVFILDTIHDPDDFTKNVGVLGVCFHVRNVRQSYQEFEPYLKGQIYILDKNGNIIYDSNEQYKREFIPFDKIQGRSTCFTKEEYIYNVIYNEQDDYYLVNLIPEEEINQEVSVLQKSILSVQMLVILAAIMLTFFGTLYFSRRMSILQETIDQIKGGKLSGFRKDRLSNDEVGDIYRELVDMGSVLEEHIDREFVYQLRQKEMELYALQTQINPHFLYNTLESIRMKLYIQGEKESSEMVYILSEMFRNIMKSGAVVTLREEFSYVQSYLKLYQFRFGDRMKYEIQAEEAIYRYATIKHILQPMIENALIHGIEDMGTEEKPSHIQIKAWKEGEDILLTVEDDGAGIPKEQLKEIQRRLACNDMFQESVGIYNVNNRLRIVYGDDYSIHIASSQGVGTKVTIRIKVMMKKELENYVQGLNS